MITDARRSKSSKLAFIWAAPLCLTAVVALAGCGDGDDENDGTQVETPSDNSFSLLSSAFGPDEPIPSRFTCDGEDISPDLSWGDVPVSLVSSALIVEDLDAEGGFVHWVIYNIPSAGLPEGVIEGLTPHTGGTQGTNDFDRLAYNGPCPPEGSRHRYRFTAYALDAIIYPPEGATKDEVLGAMEGHIQAQGQLIGTYER